MAYQALSATTPVQLTDRVANIEADLNAKESTGLLGTHFYAGGVVPSTLATFGTDTTGITTQMWLCEVRVTTNALLTGISYLIGSVGGTDKAIACLYDANGNLLANSALAGATVGTASTFQRLAFASTYQAAPGVYYIGIMTSGTTAKIQTQAGGDHNAGIVTGLTAYASSTFTLPATLTPPSTFTASKGPVSMTY